MKDRQIAFKVGICVEDDGDGFHAYCPALKGIHVEGDTREQAVENAKVASILYIKSLIEHQDPIPIQIIKIEETKNSQQKFSCSPFQNENVLVTV